MIRIYLPMQKVPKWIVKESPKDGAWHAYKAPKVVFGSLIIAYKKNGNAFLVNMWPYADFIKVTSGDHFNLSFNRVYFKGIIGTIKDSFK